MIEIFISVTAYIFKLDIAQIVFFLNITWTQLEMHWGAYTKPDQRGGLMVTLLAAALGSNPGSR